MARYIDADWIMQNLAEWQDQLAETYGQNDEYVLCLWEVLIKIDDAPTADVIERKKGKWEVHNILDYPAERMTGRKVGKCPFCGFLSGEFRTLFERNRELTNFCSNCGAEMVKGEDNEL